MRGLLAAAGNSLSSQFSLFLVCVRTDAERSSAEREAGEALKNVIKQMGWIIQATESRWEGGHYEIRWMRLRPPQSKTKQRRRRAKWCWQLRQPRAGEGILAAKKSVTSLERRRNLGVHMPACESKNLSKRRIDMALSYEVHMRGRYLVAHGESGEWTFLRQCRNFRRMRQWRSWLDECDVGERGVKIQLLFTQSCLHKGNICNIGHTYVGLSWWLAFNRLSRLQIMQ